LGVLRHARGALARLEDAEVAELQTLAVAQGDDDMLDEALDGALDGRALLAGFFRNPVDQILLGGCPHAMQPPSGVGEEQMLPRLEICHPTTGDWAGEVVRRREQPPSRPGAQYLQTRTRRQGQLRF